MTVARVLKGDRAYARPSAAHRAERILAIAERLDYRPNQAAKAVRTGRFGVIALIIPGAIGGRHLPADLLDGILAETEARELHLSIAREPLPGSPPARLWRERSVDGVLLIGAMTPMLGLSTLPHVSLGVERAQASVFPDDVAAGRQATRLLRHMGHRAIAYVASPYPVGQRGGMARERGYREGLEGVAPQVLTPQVLTPMGEDHHAWARLLLTSLDRPTAVVCGSAAYALILMQVAAELGITVPQALSLIAIDSAVVDVHAGRGPTRMALPFRQVGRIGVAQLITRMTEPTCELASLGVPYELHDGGTCAPPM